MSDTYSEFETRTGHRILERYGMTEAGMIASNPYEKERRPGTVGFALSGTRARVVSENGNEASAGSPGVLEIFGPNVFPGYWKMPDKTAEEFREDGYFITGDIATIDIEGRISIVGRAKDLIITGGFNVYPKEVEAAIDRFPGVTESAVIGVPHTDYGEGVIAIIVPKLGTTVSLDELFAHLESQLASFKRPKRIFVVDILPRNAMGKVQKNALRETYNSAFNSTVAVPSASVQ